MPADDARRALGRPVDPYVDEALTRSTYATLSDRGWRGTRIDEIAERAGIARTTVYRRCRSLEGVVVMLINNIDVPPPVPETGSLRTDLIATARQIADNWRREGQIGFGCALLAARRESPEIAAALHQYEMRQRTNQMTVFQRGHGTAWLRPERRQHLLLDAITGTILQQTITHQRRPTDDYLDELVDLLLSAPAD